MSEDNQLDGEGLRAGIVGRVRAFLVDGVWDLDVDALGFVRRLGVQVLRLGSTLLRAFWAHSCALHAAGLTYFSMLALVPVLCLLMVFAKTCGAGDFARGKINEQIEAVVVNIEKGQAASASAADAAKAESLRVQAAATRELATQVRAFTDDMFDRINKFEVGTLGWVGFGMLLWTVISSLGQVEVSMNEVWSAGKPRSLMKKVFLYLFIALVLPLLMALAMSMPILRVAKSVLDATLGATSYTKWAGDALVAVLDSRLFSLGFTLFFASLAFAFLLKVIPNCRVRARPALESGVVTALLFGGWLKFCTSAGVGIARSSALYGSFAAFPIVLAWIYMSWQIVLLGSCMTYALQCVHSRTRPAFAG